MRITHQSIQSHPNFNLARPREESVNPISRHERVQSPLLNLSFEPDQVFPQRVLLRLSVSDAVEVLQGRCDSSCLAVVRELYERRQVERLDALSMPDLNCRTSTRGEFRVYRRKGGWVKVSRAHISEARDCHTEQSVSTWREPRTSRV